MAAHEEWAIQSLQHHLVQSDFKCRPHLGERPGLVATRAILLQREEGRLRTVHFWRCTLDSYPSKRRALSEFLTRNLDGNIEEVDGASACDFLSEFWRILHEHSVVATTQRNEWLETAVLQSRNHLFARYPQIDRKIYYRAQLNS